MMPAAIGTQLRAQVFTAAAREFGRHGQTFSPTTSTLVTGERDAVLIDAQYARSEVTALGDLVERTGKRLTTIYITHGHADHYLGIGQLLTRFSTARAVAAPSVVASIEATLQSQLRQWQAMFGGEAADEVVLPDALDRDMIELEGNELRVIEVGQGDIAPSTVVHIPRIATVVAGDVVYNRIHPMLALSRPPQWEEWIASVDQIAALGASTIVAGHKRPDASDEDVATILAGTRDYICDFRDSVAASGTAEEVVEAMSAKYADYDNLTTLIVSARAAFPEPD
jgi:glyoxylase-like metal-dependent hydrolase (beta-lactamase superfamily II)